MSMFPKILQIMSTDSQTDFPETQAIRVVLADDHPVVMRGFALALGDFEISVVGQAKEPQEAIEMYEALLPDVLILDMRFGAKMSGLDVARTILTKHRNAQIIFLSQFDQDALIKECYRIGGKAFMTKSCEPSHLAKAVHLASQGETYFPEDVALRLASIAVQGDVSPQSQLEPRELEIFKMMALGKTNAEIAENLGLSSKTISNTSQTIKDKLGVQRQADMTLLAIKNSIIDPT